MTLFNMKKPDTPLLLSTDPDSAKLRAMQQYAIQLNRYALYLELRLESWEAWKNKSVNQYTQSIAEIEKKMKNE